MADMICHKVYELLMSILIKSNAPINVKPPGGGGRDIGGDSLFEEHFEQLKYSPPWGPNPYSIK